MQEEEEYTTRRIGRDKKRRIRRDMIAPLYTLILTPNGSKKAWPPRKTPQNDEYVFCQLKIKIFFLKQRFSGIKINWYD
jgi:hypothetical protein